jgi:hypothetical protein
MFSQPSSPSIAQDISDSVAGSVGSVAGSVGETTYATTTSYGSQFIEWFGSLSYLKYLVIFLILAFLGINVFTVLGNTTDAVGDAVGGPLRRIIAAVAWVTGQTAKQVVTTTADGLDKTIDIVEDVAVGGIDVVETTLTGNRSGGSAMGDLNKAANDLSHAIGDDDDDTPNTPKSGYCYIGADQGVRSCARVGEADLCMSGDIFPTIDTCVNPKLRA